MRSYLYTLYTPYEAHQRSFMTCASLRTAITNVITNQASSFCSKTGNLTRPSENLKTFKNQSMNILRARMTILIGTISKHTRNARKNIWNRGKDIWFSFDIIHYVAVFLMTMLLIFAYIETLKIRKQKALQIEREHEEGLILQHLLKGEKQERIPWPILHRKLTEMREGKIPVKSLHFLYQHVKVFYPSDWLLLMEIGNIITQHNNQSLAVKGTITDPITFRHDILENLILLKLGNRIEYVENSSLPHNDQQLKIIGPLKERFPQEIGPLLDSIIEDVRRSTMPSNSFVA